MKNPLRSLYVSDEGGCYAVSINGSTVIVDADATTAEADAAMDWLATDAGLDVSVLLHVGRSLVRGGE